MLCVAHRGRGEVIIASFERVVYPLKYASIVLCLNCLNNGPYLNITEYIVS